MKDSVDELVRLLRLDEVVQVASVELSVELRFANQSGSGTARVKLYATGDRGEGFPFVYDTAPVAELVIGLDEHGGRIIAQGPPERLARSPKSVTAPWLARGGTKRRSRRVPRARGRRRRAGARAAS